MGVQRLCSLGEMGALVDDILGVTIAAMMLFRALDVFLRLARNAASGATGSGGGRVQAGVAAEGGQGGAGFADACA